eukprot:CAMPEP_0183358940 /NCGR_PEP_ID=MMETSP0164_2-20130417/50795_1 /TAXON_ID=221442 /ORGANISM="Coccolithus pelagicus ssp braarudi, Strain PLY182g" /LENGTH=302 /DNA_ID=CAMNT_0025532947 /DNA_START=140 /DNA_END=1048 /DNA_ORIENTATION=-
MDTADINGDVFFDLQSKTAPIVCAQADQKMSSDCTNEEVIDPDLVVSKVTLHLNPSYGFGEYGRCNVCNASGVDPFSNLPCDTEYLCTCGDYRHPKDCSGAVPVGAENLTETFGNFSGCTWDQWVTGPYKCWGYYAVGKTGGMWYSTTAAGYCDTPGADPATCSWSATVIKVVNKTCSDERIYDAVEAYDAQVDGCFPHCPAAAHGAARNTSDTCWIYCFYKTVMGEDAIMPGGKAGPNIGMPLAVLNAAFESPFAPESEGGCPDLKSTAPLSASPSLKHRPRASRYASLRMRVFKHLFGRE